ncbi:MAG TPA: histidine kinase [Chitinophagaceae bacterium]|jgi:ligand-binding sensor domain-containing protein|nr:histidine kinase [Chitinophagaceae bacterium]
MNYRIINIILICIGLTSEGQEIDEKNFILYTTKDGLSHNYTSVITQDQYGYIWVATYKGLNRFDGTSFTQFYSDSGINSLPQNLLLKLKWLDKKQLAVPTFSGLHIINVENLQARNLIVPPDPIHRSYMVNNVRDVSSDRNGNIFIITTSGFYHFNKEQLVFRFDYFSKIQSTKISAFGWNINRLDDSTLLLSTFDGPYLYNSTRKDLHPVNNSDNPFYQKIAEQRALMTGLKDMEYATNVIVPGENSFSLFNIPAKKDYSIKAPFKIADNFAGDERATFMHLNDTSYILNTKKNGFYLIHYSKTENKYEFIPKLFFDGYVCNSFLKDANNRLWIATNKGLFREKRSTGKIVQTKLNESDQKELSIHSMVLSNNKLFAGTDNGLWIVEADSLKKIKRIDLSNEGGYANIFLCAAASKDTLFTGVGGFWINTKNFAYGKIISNQVDTAFDGIDLVFHGFHNNTYLKKELKNVFYYRGADGQFKILDYRKQLARVGLINTMAEDPQGNIWFGGWTLIRYNRRLQQFDTMLNSLPTINRAGISLSSNVAFDKKGCIYFGTSENGLIIYDQASKKITHLTRKEGLPDNTIRAVCYHDNKIWLGTESGLANYDIATKRISSFGIADGIPTDPMATYLLSYDSTSQQLYGAFRNIIYHFNPDKLTKNDSPPKFLIENLIIAGKETIYHPIASIDLSYKENNVVVNLNSINFEDAYQQQFAYRLLKTGSEPWQEIGSQRSIIFSDLSPGTHKLQVKVYTRSQNWPEQLKDISIIIHPPFWKTTWFGTFAAISLFTLLYLFYRLRIRHIRQKAEVDKALAQTEMKALHAQMNPHFIFNCLNSIREMILNNENKQASHYLNKFAHLIRITLNQSSKPFVSLQNTIDYLQRYLEMEKIRASNFTHSIEVDRSLNQDEILLPPMLIQPLIENAIWHGVTSLDQPMKIDIHFKKDQQQLLCVIEDDGIGIERSLKQKEAQLGHQSVGIENIKQRIRVLNEKYNLQSTISIEDKSDLIPQNGTGTIVKLRLPIKNAIV